jgi:3-deoxy-D-manno-octulosonic-acid transferase
LGQVDLIAVQSEEYAGRFRELGAAPHTVHITGSLKFDGAQTNRHNEATQRLRALAGLTDADIVFLAGSTQAPEEEVALQAFIALKDEHPRLKLVLVPRHPHRFDEVAALLDRSGLAWQRRSGLDQSPKSKVQGQNSRDLGPWTLDLGRVLLVDTIGELSAWWGTATIGFVGGSLGSRGGQNMIEPAAYGVATCFGANTRNFRDIVQLLLGDRAAVVVHDCDELTEFVRRCVTEPDFVGELGDRARSVVAAQLGATERTLSLLEHQISQPYGWTATMRAA